MKINKVYLSLILTTALIACGNNNDIQKGQRIDIEDLSVNGQQAVQTSNAAVRLAPITSRDWPQHLGGTSNEMPNAAYSSSLQLVASVNLHTTTTATPSLFGGSGTHRSVYGASAPIMVGNSIYHYDSDGFLHALSPNGASQWRISLIPSGQQAGDGYGGGLAYGNGTIYAATGYGEVVAVDASSGGVKWRYNQNAPLRQAPLLAGGKVIVISGGSTAVALNAGDGAVSWRHFGAQTEMPTRLNAGVPAGNNGEAFLAYSSGMVAKVNIASGQEVWSKAAVTDLFGGSKSVFSDITGDPVISGNNVIVGTQSGILSIEISTGYINWTSNIGTKGPIVVSGNSIMGLTPTEEMFRIDLSNGAKVYRRALPRQKTTALNWTKHTYSDVRLANNLLWVSDNKNHLLRVDPNTGAVQSSIDIPAEFAAAPIFANGYMIVMADNGQLLIYR